MRLGAVVQDPPTESRQNEKVQYKKGRAMLFGMINVDLDVDLA